MKHSEVVPLDITLTEKAQQWLSEQTKQHNETKVALVIWLNVSSSWSGSFISPEAGLVDEDKIKQHKQFIVIGKYNGYNIYRGPRVESYLPDNVRLDVRGNWGLKELYIVGVSRPVRAGYGNC